MTQANPTHTESARDLAGQALTFIGPLVLLGGGLAIWRTREHSLFFVSLMPIGLAMWGVGFYLRYGGKSHSSETSGGGGDGRE